MNNDQKLFENNPSISFSDINEFVIHKLYSDFIEENSCSKENPSMEKDNNSNNIKINYDNEEKLTEKDINVFKKVPC